MVGRFIALVALISFVLVPTAHAAWIPDGVPVCNLPGDARYPAVVGDGNRGCYVVWVDSRILGAPALYSQHIDMLGNPGATKNGVLISSSHIEDTSLPQSVVSDGQGGIFVAWSDYSTPGTNRVRAQWITNNLVNWPAGGVVVCTNSALQISPTLVPDQAGGVVVAWQDYRSGSQFDLYAQRIDGAGNRVWAAGGVPVCTRSNNQTQQRMIVDGTNGAILVWKDERAPLVYPDIYAQRITGAAGAPAWAANGIPICAAANMQFNPEVVSDGNSGAIIGWMDERVDGTGNSSYYYDVYAQRVNGTGSVLWTLDGVPLAPSDRKTQHPVDFPLRLVADGEGGAIACWDDDVLTGTRGIKAQKLDANGNRVWGALPEVVTPYIAGVAVPWEPNLRADGEGGAVVTWMDVAGGNYANVRGQRLNRYGLKVWNPEGADIFTLHTVLDFAPAFDQAMFVATSEYREAAAGGMADVYVQRVEPVHGMVGRPEPLVYTAQDVPDDQGGFVALDWWASDLDTPYNRAIDHYTIWRSVSSDSPPQELIDPRDVKAGERRPLLTRFRDSNEFFWELAGTEQAVGNAGYSYAVPTRSDAIPGGANNGHYFRILAHDKDGEVWPSTESYAYSIDNLAPAAPIQLSAQRVGDDVLLKWKRAPKKEHDFKQYELYRATSTGVLPQPVNLVSSPIDTVYTDSSAPAGTLYYIVTAIDVHTNQSAPSNEASVSGATGVSGSVPPATLTLLANVPNPFAGATELRIGLPLTDDVTLDVYDVAGRRVTSRSYPHMAPGWQRIMFDSRDGSGHALPAGVYFYRVRAGAETRTRKMIITH